MGGYTQADTFLTFTLKREVPAAALARLKSGVRFHWVIGHRVTKNLSPFGFSIIRSPDGQITRFEPPATIILNCEVQPAHEMPLLRV
jgi:hypothetical protein